LLLLLALATPPEAAAQTRRPIQANDIYRLRRASDVALSSDGSRLAYVVTQIDSADNAYYSRIWLAELDDGRARPLTHGKKRDRQPVWSPDGQRLAFVSDREGEESQIFILPLDGGEAWQATDMKHGASHPVWSPDGTRLLFLSELTTQELAAEADSGEDATTERAAMFGSLAEIRRWLAENAAKKEPAVITRLDFQGERELNPIESWSHIFVMDLETKTARRLTAGPFNHNDPAYSPDGRRIAFSATITDSIHPDFVARSDLYLMDAEGGDRRRIEIEGYSASSPAWSPDGKRLAFLARDTAARFAFNMELGVIELDAGGASGPLDWVSRPLDRSVDEFRWADDEWIYFSASVHGTVPIYSTRLGDREVLPLISGERGVLSFDLAGDRLAYVVTEPADPSEVYVASAEGDGERRVSELNAGWLAGVHVQPHHGFWYRSFDGRQVQGWLIEPVGYEPGTAHPLVLEIHGGPQAMWGPGEFTMWHEFQFLAANGYFVLYTNPRGSDGYGFEFKRAIHRAWGEGPMRDVLTAVDSVSARGGVDAQRMVVTGGSYGGYLTAYLIGHDHRFKAAVAQRGVYDLSVFFGEGNAWRVIPWEFDTYPWEDYELLRRESPITYAPQIQTPLLITHADRDLRAGVSQSEMLYRTLKVLGKPVEYVRYPREGHELSRSGEPQLRIDRLLRILEFFERYVGAGP
jgi:dipeptidyl aminopeptidase/acylaminoacyl peptidase